MSVEDLFSTIFASTYTTADFHRRVGLLRSFFEKKFFASGGGLTIQEFLIGADVSQTEVNFYLKLGDDFYNSFTKDTVYSLLDGIEAELKNNAVVLFYVPFRMPADEVAKLGLWMRENLPVNVILDLKIDPSAFGGCFFVWNGTHHDYSLRYYLAKQKDEIARLVGSYGQQH